MPSMVSGRATSPRPPATVSASSHRCREALVKPKFRQALVDLIKEAGAAGGCPKSQGALLYTTASKVRPGCAAGACRRSSVQG